MDNLFEVIGKVRLKKPLRFFCAKNSKVSKFRDAVKPTLRNICELQTMITESVTATRR